MELGENGHFSPRQLCERLVRGDRLQRLRRRCALPGEGWSTVRPHVHRTVDHLRLADHAGRVRTCHGLTELGWLAHARLTLLHGGEESRAHRWKNDAEPRRKS